jgi:ribonucleoside-diphosphate reductase alpha chain
MFNQPICLETWGDKYRLKDQKDNPVDKTPEDTCDRVSKTLSELETDQPKWLAEFNAIMGTRFSGGGRIMANAGSKSYKKEVSLINCVVSSQLADSLESIMDVAKEEALVLKAGCGIGYDFSPLRPKGARVFGAGAGTSGVISFMKVFDVVCSTILSGGGRRGSQLGALDVQHPDIEDFITAKREDKVLKYFNVSALMTEAFMKAVQNNEKWELWFWEKVRDNRVIKPDDVKLIKKNDIPFRYPNFKYFKYAEDHVEVLYKNCTTEDIFVKRVYKTINACDLFDKIVTSTYNHNDPGCLFIDTVNNENNLWFIETIRTTNPCGEVPMSPQSCCLLGSLILPAYVVNCFESNASFDWDQFKKDVRVANRALDNVVEINNLPFPALDANLKYQRRHGLGFTGLGSMFNMIGISYGSPESIKFAEKIMLTMAQESLLYNIEVAKEKGPAPVFKSVENRKEFMKSGYMKRLLKTFPNKKAIVNAILKYGVRWSHATSVAPTGTLSLTWGNNCSNGIEPVFANSYLRNIRKPGKKTKVQEEVYDYAYFEWKKKFGNEALPSYWRTTSDLTIEEHISVQSIIQKWCDASISKTINIPTEYTYEQFKDVYFTAWKSGLKGITTYRYNPKVTAGVLVQKNDLDNTAYTFILDDGTEVVVKGSDIIYYDDEEHNAANLYDALKEGLYGNM